MACRVLVSIVFVALLACDALALRTSRAASIDFSRYPVQANVRVVLVGTAPRHQASFISALRRAGFDGDGSLGWRVDKSVLTKTLLQLCPQVVPHVRHPRPAPLRVAFNLSYTVSKISSRQLDDALTSALIRAPKRNPNELIIIDVRDLFAHSHLRPRSRGRLRSTSS